MQEIIAKVKKYKKTFAAVVMALVAAGFLAAGDAEKWLGIGDNILTTIEQDVNSPSE